MKFVGRWSVVFFLLLANFALILLAEELAALTYVPGWIPISDQSVRSDLLFWLIEAIPVDLGILWFWHIKVRRGS